MIKEDLRQPDLIEALVSHTGGLEPSDSATYAELGDLRRALISSILGGQPLADIGTPLDEVLPEPELVKELAYLAANPPLEPTGITTRVARRSTPFAVPAAPGAFSAESSWTAGLKPSRTFGPFVHKAGQPWWFDVFTFSTALEVRRAGAANDFLILPAGVTVSGISHQYSIPPGSVWIASSQFTSLAPPNTFVGIRIKSGHLTVQGLDGLADPLILPQSMTVTLTVVPDPVPKSGPETGPGADATNALADFPATATFVFGPSGIESISAHTASLTAYGSTVHLTRNATATSYDSATSQILIPFAPDTTEFGISSVSSPLFQPAGSARITLAGWGFSTTAASAVSAGATAGTGALTLIVQGGLTAAWPGLSQGPVYFSKAYVEFDGEFLLLYAPTAANLRATQSFELWNDRVLSDRCRLDLAYTRPFPLLLVSDRQGFDAVSAAANVQALIDRPATAGGARLQPELQASVAIIQNVATTRVLLGSTSQPDSSGKRMALALVNALITTSPTDSFYASGILTTPTTIDQGTFGLVFRPFQILPSLADPYAANFENQIRDAPVAGIQLRVTVTWPDPSSPSLDFALPASAAPQQFAELLPAPKSLRGGWGADQFERFNQWTGDGGLNQLVLLDVSSNADQLGVAFGLVSRGKLNLGLPLTIDNLELTTTAANAKTFLLPQFQWEPVYNKFNPLVGDPEGLLFSQNDGGPTLAGVNSVTLVPVAPVSVAAEIVNAISQEHKTAAVLFTLPFGIEAVAGLDPTSFGYLARPSLQLIAPDFGTLRAARQLRLTSGARPVPGKDFFAETIQPYLEGKAQQLLNFNNQIPSNPQKPSNTLGILNTPFDSAFNDEVPISQVDLSGYGATIFSRWHNALNPDNGITQVCFDGFTGRTSYERVEMVSVLWPCLATVVRTITIERYGNGLPIRWDSGWIATSDGLFTHKGVNKFHTGPVQGFYDITEIGDTDVFVQLETRATPGADPTTLQAVYYDCNIGINNVTRGAGANGRVPARRQLGFVQYASPGGKILTPDQAREMLDTQGPLGGPIDCTITVGGSRQEMRVTGVYASNAGTNPGNGELEYAVALYGSPALPAAGHWSIVKVLNTTRTVTSVDSGLGIPLVQQGGLALRWAEPAQLFATNPDFDYAFLFSSETQKILFPRLKVEPLDLKVTSVVPPYLADPYSQLNSSGLFPLLQQAIPFPNPNFGLDSVGGTLRLSPDPLNVPISGRILSLVNVKSWNDNLDYTDVDPNNPDASGSPTEFIISSASNWTIHAKPLRQKLNFPVVGDILSLVHEIHSPADDVTNFPNPGFVFSGIMQPVADVFSMLSEWMPDLPSPLKVSASFSGSTFQLSALADFQITDKDGNAVDVGIGKLTGELKAGANLSAELLKQTITGSVFLSITGSYQQQVFPELYAGGQLYFDISADQDGKTTLDFNAGTVGSVGGDLIPGVVSLEATVKYGYWMKADSTGNVAPGIDVGMEGRAKLLDGLLGFKLGVEGRALISRPTAAGDLCELLGSILVSGSVQVAWVIDERKSWQADFNVGVNWKFALLAVKSGLLPVP